MMETKQHTLELMMTAQKQSVDVVEALNTFRGPQGPKGDDGFIKFEELTDEQKETLRGPQGKQGEPGPAGPQGVPGEPGKDAPQDAFTPSNPPTAEQVGALPSDGTAKDSEKLGGQMPSHYATAESVNQLSEQIAEGTPVKGRDYWTAADIAEIKGYVDDAILGGAW